MAGKGKGANKKGNNSYYYNRIVLRGKVIGEMRMLTTKNGKNYVSVRFGVPRGSTPKYGYDNFYLQVYGESGNDFMSNVKQGDVLAIMGKLMSARKNDEKGQPWMNNYVVVSTWAIDPADVMTKKAIEGLNAKREDRTMEEVFDGNEDEFFW